MLTYIINGVTDMWNAEEQKMVDEARKAMDEAAMWRAKGYHDAADRRERRAEAMAACAWASMNNRVNA